MVTSSGERNHLEQNKKLLQAVFPNLEKWVYWFRFLVKVVPGNGRQGDVDIVLADIIVLAKM